MSSFQIRAARARFQIRGGTSSFQIRGGTYMMQFENWRKKALDGWSGMSTCRCNARSDEIRGDQTRSRAIEWRSAVIRGHPEVI